MYSIVSLTGMFVKSDIIRNVLIVFAIFLKLGLTQSKTKQPLQDMELQEKEAQKIKAYRKSL